MTAQIAEKLYYDGQWLSMLSQPLGDYFELGGRNPGFESTSTALWRGYVGTWEIVDERLYLIDLKGSLKEGEEASLETVFPGFPERVFAHWYSGTVRVPHGKLLNYVHQGFASSYEQDLLIEIERGIVTSTRVRRNGIAKSANGPEGYGIGAMTRFPSKASDQEAH